MILILDDELDELIEYRNSLNDLITKLEQLRFNRIRRCTT